MLRGFFSSISWQWIHFQRSTLRHLNLSSFSSSKTHKLSLLRSSSFPILSSLIYFNYLSSSSSSFGVSCDPIHSSSASFTTTFSNTSLSSPSSHSNLHLIEVESPPLHQTHWDYFMKGIETSFPDRPIYLLFLADIPPNQSKRWCPDCVVAEPIIFAELEKIVPNAVVVIFSVSRAPYKAPGYPYATNPSIKLACVPTLMR